MSEFSDKVAEKLFSNCKPKKINTMLRPTQTYVTSPYGYRDLGNGKHFHNGVDLGRKDIFGKEHLEIIASFDGVIEKQWNDSLNGNAMYLVGQKGWKCGFAHLKEYTCKEGDNVKAGDVIAIMGTTGKSGGVHLHFTLRKPGESSTVDPLHYIGCNFVG